MTDAASLKEQLDHLKGELHEKPSTIMLYKMAPKKATEAAQSIVDYTEAMGPDPFEPNFPCVNPWLGKKENKGKKENPKKGAKSLAKEITI